ncbi:MAG TPA: hypothetical protein VME42_18660 [Steroidobacteraceae bacterium]|nr:hypothetical protein [Steroidobacteraceae bacterium]
MRASQLWTSLMAAALIAGMAGVPHRAIAQDAPCASRSLSREDGAQAQAAARAALPAAARLTLADACWNPRDAHARVETPRSAESSGIEQWWSVSCRREELGWQCDPAQLKQLMELSVRGAAHAVELSVDRRALLGRARQLAAAALEIYADPAARLPACEIAGPRDREPVNVPRGAVLPAGGRAIHVTLSRDGLIDSVFLLDVSVTIEFSSDEAARPRASCWNEAVIES